MGTRGTYGLYKGGVDKITYSHWDSYPTGLGKDVVKFIQRTSIEELNQIFEKIILVDESAKATDEQIEECKDYVDLNVNTGTIDNWYCLLRKAQGTLEPYKKDLRYMIDSKDFIKKSLFCEWGYIINLDTNELEIYEGFQDNPSNNRFKVTESEDGYYNCKLLKSIPLNEVSEELMDEIEG